MGFHIFSSVLLCSSGLGFLCSFVYVGLGCFACVHERTEAVVLG